MFDFDNTEFIMKVTNMREAGMIVMPLYVKVYNDTFSMLDIDTMTVYNPAGFKVGFSACVGMGIHDPFPTNVLLDYDIINVINDIDPDTGVSCKYMVLESDGNVDMDSILGKQISMYVNALKNKCKCIVDAYKATLIVDEDV